MDDQHSNIFVRDGHPRKELGPDPITPGLLTEPRDIGRRPARRSRLRIGLWLLVLAAIVAAAVIYLPRLRYSQSPAEGGRAMLGSPIPVGVATAKKGDMPVALSELGTVTPLATVTVKTQINGYLMSVAFSEGQHVKKGDFLAQVDPRPYQVALEQAQAQLAKDEATLSDAELNLKRYNTLVAQNSIAVQTRDTQVATVGQDRAQIMLDQAQINTQKLNLTYVHIISPVTGRVGLRQVDPGNYMQTSDPNGIVVVTRLQPISVIFTLPEDNLPEVLKQYHAGATMQVTAFDRTGTTQLAVGRLDTIDNQIDPTTGTVKLRAIFDNPDESLFPNQFVNVKLLVNTLHDAVLVPVSAIQRGAPGTFIYQVKPNHTVAVQLVKLGPGGGQHVAVLSGLDAGAEVVDDGADRLKDGAKVTIAPAAGKSVAAATGRDVTAPSRQSNGRPHSAQHQFRHPVVGDIAASNTVPSINIPAKLPDQRSLTGRAPPDPSTASRANERTDVPDKVVETAITAAAGPTPKGALSSKKAALLASIPAPRSTAEPAGAPTKTAESVVNAVGPSAAPTEVASIARAVSPTEMQAPRSTPSTPDPLPAQLRLPDTEIAMLLARGDALFARGDISSARLFYERAADTGAGRAALRLGNTFDPVFLEFAHLYMRAEPTTAESWYRRARQLGETKADILLTAAQRHDQHEPTAAQHQIAPAQRQSAVEHFENVTTKKSAPAAGSEQVPSLSVPPAKIRWEAP